MTKKMMTEYNNDTKETIVREMTDAEQAQHEAILQSSQQAIEESANQAVVKTLAYAKLTALGLTSDDLKALGL